MIVASHGAFPWTQAIVWSGALLALVLFFVISFLSFVKERRAAHQPIIGAQRPTNLAGWLTTIFLTGAAFVFSVFLGVVTYNRGG